MERRCEIVKVLEDMQKQLIDETSETTLQEMAARSMLKYPGSICPPTADFADPFDRVNVLLFWNMAHLLQGLTRVLQDHDPQLARVQDSSLVDSMQGSYSPSTIRESPLYEALLRVCERAGPGPEAK